jgi:putative transposase
MLRHCSDARFIWNLSCEQQLFARKYGRRTKRETWPNQIEQSRHLTEARKENEWLREGTTTVQQGAIRDFAQALKNHFNNPTHFGFPTFRTLRQTQGFMVRDVKVKKINRKWSEILVPKLGYVKFRTSRPLPSKHGHARITLNKSGQWFVSFSAPQPTIQRNVTGSMVGLDLGVINTVTDSNSNFYHGPKPRSVEFLQRKLSRQQKGSKRRERTRQKLAKISQYNTDCRKDFVEKLSTELVKQYDVIVFEALKIKNMVQSGNSSLNRGILEQGWGLLVQRCEQKAATCGVTVLKINPAYTSQTCNKCGFVSKENRENQATFDCKSCSNVANADVNAARNILAAGLAVIGRGGLKGSTKRQPPGILLV